MYDHGNNYDLGCVDKCTYCTFSFKPGDFYGAKNKEMREVPALFSCLLLLIEAPETALPTFKAENKSIRL